MTTAGQVISLCSVDRLEPRRLLGRRRLLSSVNLPLLPVPPRSMTYKDIDLLALQPASTRHSSTPSFFRNMSNDNHYDDDTPSSPLSTPITPVFPTASSALPDLGSFVEPYGALSKTYSPSYPGFVLESDYDEFCSFALVRSHVCLYVSVADCPYVNSPTILLVRLITSPLEAPTSFRISPSPTITLLCTYPTRLLPHPRQSCAMAESSKRALPVRAFLLAVLDTVFLFYLPRKPLLAPLLLSQRFSLRSGVTLLSRIRVLEDSG